MKRTLLALAVTLTAGLALAPGASAAEFNCPGTFQVLHNDRIGSMQLPAGPYVITLLDENEIGCSEASRLFAQFLEDWDGRLPRPWMANPSTRTFREGRRNIGFRVTPVSTPPTPPHPPSSRVCPGYFHVLHNDRIGSFRIPAGRYHLILLSRSSAYTCSMAVRDFQLFLQDWDGRLPRPWFLDTSTGSFIKGSTHLGFRIRRYRTSGGHRHGRHPIRGQRKCPATFRVLHNDRIGRLRLPRGNYNVWVSGGLSCPGSSRLFAEFLQDPNGVLPRPWRLNVRTATFKRGRSNFGFRVKLQSR